MQQGLRIQSSLIILHHIPRSRRVVRMGPALLPGGTHRARVLELKAALELHFSDWPVLQTGNEATGEPRLSRGHRLVPSLQCEPRSLGCQPRSLCRAHVDTALESRGNSITEWRFKNVSNMPSLTQDDFVLRRRMFMENHLLKNFIFFLIIIICLWKDIAQ